LNREGTKTRRHEEDKETTEAQRHGGTEKKEKTVMRGLDPRIHGAIRANG
jgi:hypothetical protein